MKGGEKNNQAVGDGRRKKKGAFSGEEMEAETTGSSDTQVEGSLTVPSRGAGQGDHQGCLN